MNKSFDVFLSHNSKDKPAVRALAEALRERGLNVWLDEWELVPGRRWQEALEEIIRTVQCAAVLVGKDGLGPWEIPEMRACLSQFVRRELPVIPVLLPGAPQEPELPLFLQGFTWADLRDGLTEDRLDQLQWGITGEKPRRTLTADRPAAVQAKTQAAAHAQAFTESLTGIRFLWIPGGWFQMGGTARNDEKPVHWVRISPFWLAETPVTNRQYAVFLEKTGAKEPAYWRDQRFSSPNQPVVGVSWKDAAAFCQWLSVESHRQVMLPSEAQWEFAARGTAGREYPWGNEPPDETRACFNFDVRKGQPAPVGSYPAGRGPFGTLDQAGNVWEWCCDAWDERAYSKRVEKGEEPLDPIVREEEDRGEVRRIARGGSCNCPAVWLRAASRFHPPWWYLMAVGFRVAAAPASLDS